MYGHDQIAVDVLDEEIDDDRPEARARSRREKPTATISTPETIAPILGMKASRPVSRPSRAAIGTPPTISSMPGEDALERPCRPGGRPSAGAA